MDDHKRKKHKRSLSEEEYSERKSHKHSKDLNFTDEKNTDSSSLHHKRKKHKKDKHYSEPSESSRKEKSQIYRHEKEKSPKRSRHDRHRKESVKKEDECIKRKNDEDMIARNKPISSDYEFDWENYKGYLDRIFFHQSGIIFKHSEEHTDFWNFLKKYVAFQKKKQSFAKVDEKAGNRCEPNEENKFGFPTTYDNSCKLNFDLEIEVNRTALADLHGRRAELELTEVRLEQFKQIIVHYFDFAQKQKLAKLQKIKRDKENLPMFKYKDRVISAIKEHQVVVVAGDTGCGKSTQVPQYLIAAGFENIACTQPRRIACISLSKRVSYETLNEYGSEVAYQVRFEKSRTKATKILFLTEGLLLRQIGSDPLLTQYNVIVIDEVHERHIHTDFLLGVVKCILKQRKDLKIILMSATININMFSSYFDNAPVVSVPGRLYPIQLQYFPLSIEEQGSKTEKLDPMPYLRVLQSIDKKYPPTERGDVLMFLSGLTEIMTVVDAAKQYASKTNKWIILPLHSALSLEDQDKCFDFPPEGVRKCIVSTNIAETSVTIDGVRFVVDSGKVKEMNYDTKYQMQKLSEFWISRASAEQRKGRAGRTGPGVCFRLYSESDYDALQAYSTPEIRRVPIDSILLQMADLGLHNARMFPFIERPEETTIENSITYLKEQKAFDEKEELTTVGKILAQLPVDLVIGKMLLMGSLFEMVEPVLCISSALSVQSPYTVRGQTDSQACAAREQLQSNHGDPFMLLNALDHWMQIKAEGKDSRKWCKRRGLEEQRFYEMSKLKKNFQQLLQDYDLIAKVERVEELSREERKQMTLDRKRLKELRHEQKSQSKKRKVLKMADDNWEVDFGTTSDTETLDPNTSVEFSVKDLEFRLSNDLTQIQNEGNQTHKLTLKDINILKVILCSGLYPQVAIADEHNGFKSSSEQIFHTKNKGFVVLHPTSVFSLNPDFLLPSIVKDNQGNMATKGSVQSVQRGVVSNNHQLLTYVSLVETNKPYLTGVMRVPALLLLLFSNEVDTNSDCRRIVCDTWLEINLDSTPDEAEQLISSMYKLRNAWTYLTQLKLQNFKRNADRENKKGIEDHFEKEKTDLTVRKLRRFVSQKLAEFVSYDINYTLRRVLPAEAAHMYIGASSDSSNQAMAQDIKSKLHTEFEQTNEEEVTPVPHPIKGGIHVAPYLVIHCLAENSSDSWNEYTSYIQKHWTCPHCSKEMIVTFGEQLQHDAICGNRKPIAESLQEVVVEETKKVKNINTKSYHCEKCDNTYEFTTVEILKHRKKCYSNE